MVRIQTGGPVQSGRLYIERPADRALPAALRDGKLCAVFAPRQEGKTSLMVRTLDALAEDGLRCAYVELASLHARTVEALFDGLRGELSIALDGPISAATMDRAPGPAFADWLTAIAGRSEQRVVVFIDEIQELLADRALGEALLNSIRLLHEARARNPALSRLTFCVAGVTRPRDLVRDGASNPFEPETFIRLEDFTRDELASADQPADVLDEVFRWTSGHPYMTAALLRELAATPRPEGTSAAAHVDRVVRDTLLSEQVRSEQALADARLLFTGEAQFGGADLAGAVEVYRSLLKGERVLEAAAGDSAVVLQLCGVAAGRVRGDARVLEVRNRIIARTYGEPWLQQMEVARYLDQPMQRWRSLERAPSALLAGGELAVAVAVAKRADEVSQDQRAYLLASIEAESSKALASQREELEATQRKMIDTLGRQHERAVEATSAMSSRFARQRWTYLGMFGIAVIAFMAAFFSAYLSNQRASSLARQEELDKAQAKKSLDDIAAAQKAKEEASKTALVEVQRKADVAQQDAADAKRILDQAATYSAKLERDYQAARAKAEQLTDQVAVAQKDYQLVVAASAAAEQRARTAEASAQATLDALRAEAGQRQAAEQQLATERSQRASCERERDACKLDTASCRQDLGAAINACAKLAPVRLMPQSPPHAPPPNRSAPPGSGSGSGSGSDRPTAQTSPHDGASKK